MMTTRAQQRPERARPERASPERVDPGRPSEQARDRLRDQAHTAAGLIPLRFTHEQVRYEPEHVLAILAQRASRLAISTK